MRELVYMKYKNGSTVDMDMVRDGLRILNEIQNKFSKFWSATLIKM